MSQAIAYSDSNIQWTTVDWSEDIRWTGIVNISSTPAIDDIDELHHFSRQARAAAIKLAETASQLSLTPLAFDNSIHTSAIVVDNIDLDLEDDIWVEMPPLFTRRVNAKARNGGQGQPLVDLEPLDED